MVATGHPRLYPTWTWRYARLSASIYAVPLLGGVTLVICLLLLFAQNARGGVCRASLAHQPAVLGLSPDIALSFATAVPGTGAASHAAWTPVSPLAVETMNCANKSL
jgi:hypothetical protein